MLGETAGNDKNCCRRWTKNVVTEYQQRDSHLKRRPEKVLLRHTTHLVCCAYQKLSTIMP